MSSTRRQIIALAASYGFALQRQRKHLVFIHPSGARVATAATPSCHHALNNIERQFRRVLTGAAETSRPTAANR